MAGAYGSSDLTNSASEGAAFTNLYRSQVGGVIGLF